MIEHIGVSTADMVAQDPWRLCLRVGYVIERVKEQGGEAELMPDALRFADLWEYHGEVANGGHAQFYENEEDCVHQLNAMRELLRRVGLPAHAELLSKFERVAIDNEDRISALWASGDEGTVKQLFYEIDDRFAELERSEGKLQDHLREWLIQQPWIVTEND